MELPTEMRYIWKYFSDLNSKRLNTGYGYLPIQYSEIKSYFDLYSIDYEPMEVYLIELLDGVTMQYFAEDAEKKDAAEKAKASRKK